MTELEMFIDGLKYKIKKRTSKAAPLVLAGTIGATLLGAVGCNNKNIGNETTKPVVEKEISTEIPEIPENPVVVDEYQDAYNTIDSIENKTVAFINDGLENGFYDYGKELTEDQKREIVKMTLYSNLLVNRDEIGGVPLAIINGNCSCNCNCDCNCCNCNDIYYVCPNCKKVVNKYDSCKEKCKGCCSIF